MLDRLLSLRTAPAWFFLLLFGVYAATANYVGAEAGDVLSTAQASWSLATRGTLDLSDLPYESAWLVPVGDAEFSNRFPGAILGGTLFYLLAQPSEPFVAHGALAACLVSALGVTGILVALRTWLPVRWAYASAAALGLGSGVWAVGANTLWSHGTTTFWLGMVMAGLVQEQRWRALVLLGAVGAVLTRPHLAVALGVTALLLARRDRTAWWLLSIGVLLGAGLYVVYLRLVFGFWSVTGPYAIYDYDVAVEYQGDTAPADEATWRLTNFAMALVSPRVGLLHAYPALVFAVIALVREWRRVPPTALALGAGALAYAVIALWLTRVSGGTTFWGNRTLIESVVLAWPACSIALARFHGGRWWRMGLSAAVAWAVWLHALGALTIPTPLAPDVSSVMYWQVDDAVLTIAWWRTVLALLLSATAGVVTWRLLRGPHSERSLRAETASTAA